MARKLYYLIPRKDVRIKGRPIYYCRFRSPDGEILPWRSTGETTKTRAELWAVKHLAESKERRENIFLYP